MARPKRTPVVKLEVQHTPLPPERVHAWKAGALLLLALLRERRDKRIDRARSTMTIEQKKPSSLRDDEG